MVFLDFFKNDYQSSACAQDGEHAATVLWRDCHVQKIRQLIVLGDTRVPVDLRSSIDNKYYIYNIYKFDVYNL